MPISKHFSPGSPDSRMGRRRPRLEITREMISAPLGDFRHTMHVGRGGDAFGDTSFLRERPPPENPRYRRGESPPPAGRESLLARTLRASKRSLSVGRSARLSSTSTSSFVAVPLPSSPSSSASASSYSASTPSSPVGVSQPLSRSEMEVQCIAPPGGERASRSPGPVRTPLAPVGSIAGVTAGFSPYSGGGGGNAIARPNGAMDGQEPLFDRRDQALAHSIPVLKHAESVMSFHVDLGPSMLGDVLGVMGSEEGGAAAPGFEVVAAAAPAATPGRGGSSRGGSRSSSASSSGGSSATLADDAASQGDGEGDGGAWAAAASEKRPAALPAALPTMPFVASLHHHHHPFGSYLEDDEILPF
ncbi:cdc42 effector protein 4-like [Lethenteron reissneri]|uniref:cdc42 effector protein 4-like n=1 Tax=Lethenteron reissneri TaxID=7753 RepID=UPI002AB75CA5|nr:cdc42 effector protein 4-like [Lethenteron reissneri]